MKTLLMNALMWQRWQSADLSHRWMSYRKCLTVSSVVLGSLCVCCPGPPVWPDAFPSLTVWEKVPQQPTVSWHAVSCENRKSVCVCVSHKGLAWLWCHLLFGVRCVHVSNSHSLLIAERKHCVSDRHLGVREEDVSSASHNITVTYIVW